MHVPAAQRCQIYDICHFAVCRLTLNVLLSNIDQWVIRYKLLNSFQSSWVFLCFPSADAPFMSRVLSTFLCCPAWTCELWKKWTGGLQVSYIWGRCLSGPSERTIPWIPVFVVIIIDLCGKFTFPSRSRFSPVNSCIAGMSGKGCPQMRLMNQFTREWLAAQWLSSHSLQTWCTY